MLSISEERNINFENFFNYARNIGVHINKELYVKKIYKNNNGIFINNSIDPNQLLVSLPKKFVISKNTFRNLILEQRPDYVDLKFLENYFLSLPNFKYFKKNSIMFIDEEKKNKILNLFVDLSPTKRKIHHLFQSFSELSDFEKYISIIFKSRSFIFENNQYLCPIVDLINYKYGSPIAANNKEGIYFKNNELLKNSDQFFHGYDNHNNIVFFFLKYNFVPDNFNTVSIPSNFFSLNIPQNKKDTIDEDYWHVKDGKFSNKKKIVFENLKFPLDFKLEINKIIPNNSTVNKITISILEMLRDEIKYKEVIEFINEETDGDITHSFAETLKINYSKIEQLISKLISKE